MYNECTTCLFIMQFYWSNLLHGNSSPDIIFLVALSTVILSIIHSNAVRNAPADLYRWSGAFGCVMCFAIVSTLNLTALCEGTLSPPATKSLSSVSGFRSTNYIRGMS